MRNLQDGREKIKRRKKDGVMIIPRERESEKIIIEYQRNFNLI